MFGSATPNVREAGETFLAGFEGGNEDRKGPLRTPQLANPIAFDHIRLSLSVCALDSFDAGDG